MAKETRYVQITLSESEAFFASVACTLVTCTMLKQHENGEAASWSLTRGYRDGMFGYRDLISLNDKLGKVADAFTRE